MFQNALVRTPSQSLIHGLTSSPTLGKPDYELALQQHQHYINALSQCGLEVTILPAIDAFPDSCFVEDVALLTPQLAVLTRPGALSRQDEVKEIEEAVRAFYNNSVARIEPPGCLEAGNILNVDNHYYIGLSARTNDDGARQMIHYLNQKGYSASTVPLTEFLHLKTGVSYLDQGHLLLSGELINHPAFSQFKHVIISEEEAYAANCIMINGTVLLAQGYPETKEQIMKLGYPMIELDMSEFRKIDGGLSCLSLRF